MLVKNMTQPEFIPQVVRVNDPYFHPVNSLNVYVEVKIKH
jgi:hypothetical protein